MQNVQYLVVNQILHHHLLHQVIVIVLKHKVIIKISEITVEVAVETNIKNLKRKARNDNYKTLAN